jgi:hypothetical protein
MRVVPFYSWQTYSVRLLRKPQAMFLAKVQQPLETKQTGNAVLFSGRIFTASFQQIAGL